jgi:hypothetical protein
MNTFATPGPAIPTDYQPLKNVMVSFGECDGKSKRDTTTAEKQIHRLFLNCVVEGG